MHIDERAVKILVQHGLRVRFPFECNAFQKILEDVRKAEEDSQILEKREIDAKLKCESPQREETLREEIRRVISEIFPSVFLLFPYL